MNAQQIKRKRASRAFLDVCMSLEPYDLQIVLAISEAGGIRRASVELGIGQSAVTRRIQKLEDALGVSLFERSQTGTRLTVAGWDFAGHARQLINDLRFAVASAHSAGEGRSGQLRLGLIASLSRGSLRDIVSRFLAQHPDVSISFAEADRNELITLLSHRALDAVFLAGEMQAGENDTLLVAKEQVYLAVDHQHQLANRDTLRWNDIEKASFVISASEPGPTIYNYLLKRVGALGHQLHLQQHRLDREGIMNLVGLGLGVSVMCEHWRGVRYPSVAFVPIEANGHLETVPFSLIWRPENDNPALRRFLSLAREVAKVDAASSGLS